MTLLNITLIFFFFFNDTATTEIYTLSLHDALPICNALIDFFLGPAAEVRHIPHEVGPHALGIELSRSEEHTSELQSQSNLVCRLLLEKKIIVLPLVGHRSHRSAYTGQITQPTTCLA